MREGNWLFLDPVLGVLGLNTDGGGFGWLVFRGEVANLGVVSASLGLNTVRAAT